MPKPITSEEAARDGTKQSTRFGGHGGQAESIISNPRDGTKQSVRGTQQTASASKRTPKNSMPQSAKGTARKKTIGAPEGTTRGSRKR